MQIGIESKKKLVIYFYEHIIENLMNFISFQYGAVGVLKKKKLKKFSLFALFFSLS